MQAKHTPGPWAVNGPTIAAAPTDAAPTGYAIAHILNPYAGATGAASRVAANAALIAAAPDMLAMLAEVTRCLAWHAQEHPVGMDSVAVSRARAIIARATGEA